MESRRLAEWLVLHRFIAAGGLDDIRHSRGRERLRKKTGDGSMKTGTGDRSPSLKASVNEKDRSGACGLTAGGASGTRAAVGPLRDGRGTGEFACSSLGALA